MTIDCNGIPGVISWLAVIAFFWFAWGAQIPKIGPRWFWKIVLLLCAGYLVFFYAFR
jgi:hypothetical protein